MIKKSLCIWRLQYTSFLSHYWAQSYCSAADRQGQGDNRLTLTPSVIPNSNYVIMVIDWNCLNIFACFCTVIIRSTDNFLSSCTCTTRLFTYSMEQSSSWEANRSLQLVKKLPSFYGTRRFFTVLTIARHLSLSWAESIQSPQPTQTSWKIHLNTILPSTSGSSQ
jgi:hypothetical protein